MRRRVALIGTSMLLLGGCVDSSSAEAGASGDGRTEAQEGEARVLQPGAPGEETVELSPEEASALLEDVDEYSPADVEFLQQMIGHHVQAVRMTRLAPDRAGEDIELVARRMDISQEDEIELMRTWLEDNDEEVPSLLAHHDHADDGDTDLQDHTDMPGMLTEEQLQRLEDAEGDEFDRLFLEYMVYHHEGALQMIDELYADLEAGGESVEINALANHMYSDQELEITRMSELLADRGGPVPGED